MAPTPPSHRRRIRCSARSRTALRALGHAPARVAVAGDVEAVIDALRAAEPAIVFNLAESFDGKSALESNVAGAAQPARPALHRIESVPGC